MGELALLLLVLALSGCHQSNPYGLSDSQQKGISKIQTIAQYSGGDWNKVTPADQAYLIKGAGSAASAKMMLSMDASGGPQKSQAGPPPGKSAP